MQQSDFGEIIEKRRRFLKLTQQQLAEYAGVSVRSLKLIESGSGNPTTLQLTKILEILGMRINIQVK